MTAGVHVCGDDIVRGSSQLVHAGTATMWRMEVEYWACEHAVMYVHSMGLHQTLETRVYVLQCEHAHAYSIRAT